ncbi:tetratricopeptide repeat protein [Magnetospirillum sp. UT-4]|uniref:tetratricopeptide repeat protein n=1 Tax=Magnetospirillum sp. UT-4 TaxID=2681467 RepID=UPI0013858C1E|nr:tetratricopeptide repeat protein [Magnetospirillum sp. UT-4]CAA7618272.1 hypothetical protein MTBUT4_30001 [Magnetospirillum sp. UT-4]
MSAPALQPVPHPWLDRFAAEPAAALADLLAGEAYLPGLQRATPCQALEVMFGDLPRSPAPTLWDLLDETLLDWLKGLKGRADTLIERPGGVRRFITEAGEAYRAVHRLELARCAAWLASAWPDEAAWAERFVENSAFDLADLVLGAAANVQTDDRFRFEWLRACEASANRRLRHRIDATLLGVASMPGPEPMPRQEVLVGLARWGGAMDGENDHRAQQQFIRRVRQLKAAFPQSRDFWLDRWGAILAGKRTAPHVRDWVCSVWPELQKPGVGTAKVPTLPPSVEYEVKAFSAAWRKAPSPGLLAEMQDLLALLERYAVATGDAHFLVTSSSNLGRTVRDGAPGHVLAWMRRASRWSPFHEQSWSLRADCLARLGRRDEAEAVLWEAIRRLPHRAPLRHQLARLLAGRGADAAAERLLREALERDPDHEHSEGDLARLLWRGGQGDEAVERLRSFTRRLAAERRDNPTALYTLAEILIAEGQAVAARAVRDRYVERFGNNNFAGTLTRWLEAGPRGVDQVRALLAERHTATETSLPLDHEAAAAALAAEAAEAPLLRRAAWGTEADLYLRLGDRATATAVAGQALAADADDVLATTVMALGDDGFRQDLRQRLHRFPGLLPVRLAALADGASPDEDWEQVRAAFTDPEDKGLIALVHAGLAKGSPDAELEAWIRRPAGQGDEGGAFLKAQVARNLDGRDAALDLATLAHDALLRQANPPGTIPQAA